MEQEYHNYHIEMYILCRGAGVASPVEVMELDDPVWAALAAVRSLGVLSVLLGWGPGLGAGAIGAGVLA